MRSTRAVDAVAMTAPASAQPPRSSHLNGAMIEPLVPSLACAEMFSDVPESAMFPVEAALVAGAVTERRREFGTVRYCARKALRKIGVPAGPLIPDEDGAPLWPIGVVGSMTHCSGYRAAVLARSWDLRAVGIDAEPHAPVPEAALDLVLREEERERLPKLAAARPDLHWDRILFCAKEAVYKAWFPLTRRWLDFADVSVTARPDGSFRAHVHVPGFDNLGPFDGRWAVGRGLVVAVTAVGRRPPVWLPSFAGVA